jgi:hypothetical protein
MTIVLEQGKSRNASIFFMPRRLSREAEDDERERVFDLCPVIGVGPVASLSAHSLDEREVVISEHAMDVDTILTEAIVRD